MDVTNALIPYNRGFQPFVPFPFWRCLHQPIPPVVSEQQKQLLKLFRNVIISCPRRVASFPTGGNPPSPIGKDGLTHTHQSAESVDTFGDGIDACAFPQIDRLEQLIVTQTVLLSGLLESRNVLHQFEVHSFLGDFLHRSGLEFIDQTAMQKSPLINTTLNSTIIFAKI